MWRGLNMTTSKVYSTFHVADFYFGIPTAQGVEVSNGFEVTPAPLGPIEVAGFINLRGQIVTAIDMHARLGMAPQKPRPGGIALFFKEKDSLFGLLVDEANEILELDETSFEQPPSNLPERARDLISGVYKLPNQLLLILETQKIVSGISLMQR